LRSWSAAPFVCGVRAGPSLYGIGSAVMSWVGACSGSAIPYWAVLRPRGSVAPAGRRRPGIGGCRRELPAISSGMCAGWKVVVVGVEHQRPSRAAWLTGYGRCELSIGSRESCRFPPASPTSAVDPSLTTGSGGHGRQQFRLLPAGSTVLTRFVAAVRWHPARGFRRSRARRRVCEPGEGSAFPRLRSTNS
jgi:hypothetical protein